MTDAASSMPVSSITSAAIRRTPGATAERITSIASEYESQPISATVVRPTGRWSRRRTAVMTARVPSDPHSSAPRS